MDDEEIARRLLAVPEGPPEPMDLTGWTYERELLTALLEAVQRQTAWLIGVHSKDHKVPPVASLPRPETAVQRARLSLLDDNLAEVIAAFKPRE